MDSGSPIHSRSPKDARLQVDTGSPMATHSPSSPADPMHKLKQGHHMGPGTPQQMAQQSPSADAARNEMYPQYHSGAAMHPYPDQPPKAPVPQYPAMSNEYRPDMSATNQPYGSRGFPYLPPPLSNEQSVHNQYKIGTSAAEKALAEQYLATMTRASQEPYANRAYRLPTDHEAGASKASPGGLPPPGPHEQPYSAFAPNRVPGREEPGLSQQSQGRLVPQPGSQEAMMSKYAMEQYQSSMMQGGDQAVRQYYQMQQQQQMKEQAPYHQQYQDSSMHQQMIQQQYQQQQLEEQKTLPKKKRPTKKQLKQQQEQMELEAQMKQQQMQQLQQQQAQQSHQQLQHQQELQHEQQRHQAQLQQQHMQQQQQLQHQQMQQGQHQQYNQLQHLQEQRNLQHEAQLQQQQYQQHLQQQLIQQQSQQVPRSRTPVSSFPVKKRHYAEPLSQSPGPFPALGGDATLGKGAFSQPMRSSAPSSSAPSSSAPASATPGGYPAPAIAHAGNAAGSGDAAAQRPQFLQAPSAVGVPRSPFTPVSTGTELSNPRDIFSSAVRNDPSMSRSPFTPVTSSSESTRSPRGTYPSSDMNPRSPFTPTTVGSSIGLPHAGLGHMMDVYQHSPLYNPNHALFPRPGSAFRESQQPGSVSSGSAPAAAANQGFNAQANEAANKAVASKQAKGRRKSKADGGPAESSSPSASPAASTATASAATAFQQYASKGVLPTSAFNFSPSAAPLPGLYSDKDAFPNYLEDYRSGQAGFYGHSRASTESADKSVHNVANVPPVAAVPAVQTASAPFPFLGHQTSRPPSYPLAQPFPYDPATYQQYLLHQGLYSSGYHHALGLRQPYDPIQRPHWL